MKLSAKLSIALLVATMAFSAIGCQGTMPDPPVNPGQEQPAANGGKLSVDSFILTTPDFIDRDGNAQRTVNGQGKVAILRMRISNPTGSDIKYKPLHFQDAGERIQICTDPDQKTGERADVAAISFDKGKMIHTPEQHIEDQVTIPAGKDITDDYLFEVPMTPEGKRLVALVPGAILGDASSKVFRFYLDPPTTKAPKEPSKLNQPVTVDGLKVTITKVATEYAELEEINPAKKLDYPYAYTKNPVLAIYATINNSSTKALTYAPGHSTEVPGIKLSMQNENLKRIKLEDKVIGKGQVKNKFSIAPGSSLDDVFLFELPSTNGMLSFTLSGSVFGVNGIYRYNLDFIKTNPPEPDLKPYLKGDKDEEDADEDGADDAAAAAPAPAADAAAAPAAKK